MRNKNVAASRKPNSVRLRSPYGELRRNDHSSSPAIAGGIERPTRRLGRAVRPPPARCRAWQWAPPYLVLLRAGFCLPPVLPPARCALTAPFHPYPSTRVRLAPDARSGRYVFCATVLQVTLTGRYPAHCPAEFGLSSLERCTRNTQRRSSGSLRTRHSTTAGRARQAGWAGSALCPSRPSSPSRLSCPTIHRFPALSGTARASCRDCCAACR